MGLPNATEVTFSDFARKIPFGRFWPIVVKKIASFWPKINVSANFSKSSHRILVLYFGEKTLFWPFWFFLGQKNIACGDKMVFSEVFGLFHPLF